MKRALSMATLLLLAMMAMIGCAGDQMPAASRQPPATSNEPPALSPQIPALQRDLTDLATRFGIVEPPIARVARDEPWGFVIGDSHDFWVQDKGTGDYHQVAAENAAQMIWLADQLPLVKKKFNRYLNMQDTK